MILSFPFSVVVVLRRTERVLRCWLSTPSQGVFYLLFWHSTFSPLSLLYFLRFRPSGPFLLFQIVFLNIVHPRVWSLVGLGLLPVTLLYLKNTCLVWMKERLIARYRTGCVKTHWLLALKIVLDRAVIASICLLACCEVTKGFFPCCTCLSFFHNYRVQQSLHRHSSRVMAGEAWACMDLCVCSISKLNQYLSARYKNILKELSLAFHPIYKRNFRTFVFIWIQNNKVKNLHSRSFLRPVCTTVYKMKISTKELVWLKCALWLPELYRGQKWWISSPNFTQKPHHISPINFCMKIHNWTTATENIAFRHLPQETF